jgi:hypothetical protein
MPEHDGLLHVVLTVLHHLVHVFMLHLPPLHLAVHPLHSLALLLTTCARLLLCR